MDVKVLSLYDGMSCGMIAMLHAGVQVERYVAYEIDKYAIKTSKYNFPEIEHMGDVFKADFTQYNDFDFLIGGSPCTKWSIAQKNGRETEASGQGWEWFQQFVRALNEAKPKYFIYENNKSMSNAIRDNIRKTFGFEEICINSALVSAQNRQRYYWVGKRNNDGTYSQVFVPQPNDKGILLKDVLDGADAWQDKSFAYTTRCQSAIPDDTLSKHRHILEPVRVGGMPRPNGKTSNSQGMRIYSADGKSVNQTAQGGGMGAKTGLYAIPCCVAQRGRYENAENLDSKTKITQHYEARSDEKTNAITTVSKNNMVAEIIPQYAITCEWNDNGIPTKAVSGADKKVYPVYYVYNGKITIKEKKYPIKLLDGYYIIRKLTVNECKRLQTVPEWYDFSCVSNTQAYKMLGNGWTCDVITHLICSCLDEK